MFDGPAMIPSPSDPSGSLGSSLLSLSAPSPVSLSFPFPNLCVLLLPPSPLPDGPDPLSKKPVVPSAMLGVRERVMTVREVLALTETSLSDVRSLPSSLNTGRGYEQDFVKILEEKGENNFPSSKNTGEMRFSSGSMNRKT